MTSAEIVKACESGAYRIKHAHGTRRYTLERYTEKHGWLIGVPIRRDCALRAAVQLIEARGEHITTWTR